jgi:hypothetical protein
MISLSDPDMWYGTVPGTCSKNCIINPPSMYLRTENPGLWGDFNLQRQVEKLRPCAVRSDPAKKISFSSDKLSVFLTYWKQYGTTIKYLVFSRIKTGPDKIRFLWTMELPPYLYSENVGYLPLRCSCNFVVYYLTLVKQEKISNHLTSPFKNRCNAFSVRGIWRTNIVIKSINTLDTKFASFIF